jgi:hypothetical protein
MTKEEIALQLTLARIDKLKPTEYSSADKLQRNISYNEAIAEETVKLFNTIYSGIKIDSDKQS